MPVHLPPALPAPRRLPSSALPDPSRRAIPPLPDPSRRATPSCATRPFSVQSWPHQLAPDRPFLVSTVPSVTALLFPPRSSPTDLPAHSTPVRPDEPCPPAPNHACPGHADEPFHPEPNRLTSRSCPALSSRLAGPFLSGPPRTDYPARAIPPRPAPRRLARPSHPAPVRPT